METLKDIHEPRATSLCKALISTSPKVISASFECQNEVKEQKISTTLHPTSNRARAKRRPARLMALSQKIGQINRRPNSRTYIKDSSCSLEIRSSLISQPPEVPRSLSGLHLIKTNLLSSKRADRLSVKRSR